MLPQPPGMRGNLASRIAIGLSNCSDLLPSLPQQIEEDGCPSEAKWPITIGKILARATSDHTSTADSDFPCRAANYLC